MMINYFILIMILFAKTCPNVLVFFFKKRILVKPGTSIWQTLQMFHARKKRENHVEV